MSTSSSPARTHAVTVAVLAAGAAALWWWLGRRLTKDDAGDSTLRACGWGGHGQLGCGSLDVRPEPVAVVIKDPIEMVAAGGLHFAGYSMALTNDGHVLAWGANEHGQLGQGDTAHRMVPTRVPFPERVSAVACGTQHAVFVCAYGQVPHSVGDNTFHQLGRPTNSSYATQPGPMLLHHLETGKLHHRQSLNMIFVTAAACGDAHTALLTSSGEVHLFGCSDSGQLGVAPPARFSQHLLRAVAVACGSEHTLVLTKKGAVVSFGSNTHGQLGYATHSAAENSPKRVKALVEPMAAIAAGARHSLCVGRSGAVYSWGSNEHGQLGRGLSDGHLSSETPAAVFHGAARIWAGGLASGVIDHAGVAFACGCNTEGQLGVHTAVGASSVCDYSINVEQFTRVRALRGPVRCAASAEAHTLFLLAE